MPTKADIMEHIGERGLLMPGLVARGLAANDRLKYFVKLLQAAQAHASAPTLPARDLRVEREACGIIDQTFDHIVEGSSSIGNDTLHIPEAASIVKHLFEELAHMVEPLRLAGSSRADVRARFEVYQRRLDDLIVHGPSCQNDHFPISSISALTGVSGNGHDTVHHLAIDLLWELNRLQASVSMETIDGANVYDLLDTDRVLVRAFMKGINETAHLTFDHTGLATLATRDADRLSIQSDLGTTAAHLLVVHITGFSVALTYTDNQRSRMRFFHGLLQPHGVKWTDAVTAGSDFEMSIGRYVADDADALSQFLTFVGSRLVFLIDWNRARKRLLQFVRKSDALGLLKWAADNNIGHRAFLQIRAVELIDAAIERAAPFQVRPGMRLDDWLGREPAALFLMSVLRTASSGLSAGHSRSLIGDEIEAELLRYLQAADRHMLHGPAEQAAMISALVERVIRAVADAKNGEERNNVIQTAALAKTWRARVDQIGAHAVWLLKRIPQDNELRQLLREADAMAEALEEAAYLLTLLPTTPDLKAMAVLGELAEVVGAGVREYVRCLDGGRDLSPASPRTEVDAFLMSVDRLAEVDHQTGTTQRTLTEQLLRGQSAFHHFYVLTGIARELTRAASALARCGVLVRDHVLNAQPR
jgi:hypothetical protein